MKEFDYERLGEYYEDALDYVQNIVAGNQPKEFSEDEIYGIINNYVEIKYYELPPEDQDTVIDEAFEQYYLLQD